MDANDPRRQLDPFAATIAHKLKVELEIAVKKLACSDRDLALAQIERLREGALYRLKNWDFEVDALDPDRPEEDVVQIIAVVIATLEDAFAECRRHAIKCADILYGDPSDDDPPE